jgi:hypothetical protein
MDALCGAFVGGVLGRLLGRRRSRAPSLSWSTKKIKRM